jgi:hypothetical protein
VAHELAAGLDQRARALGEQLAASPEPWLASRLGVLAPHASPLLREDYARRAAAAAAYREAAGITDLGQAIAPGPHRGNPELDHLRRTAIRALEIRDETAIIRRMTRGELEARILDGDRAVASAPRDVSRDLRLTAQTEADAWQQSADAEAKHDPAGSADATALARHLAARREQLETANARYEKWAADTGSRREAAGKARPSWSGASSRSRQPGSSPPSPKADRRPWWSGGASWKPASPPWTGPSSVSARPRSPQARPGRPSASHRPRPRPAEAAAVIARLQRDGYRPEPNPDREAPASESAASNTGAPAPQHEPGDQPGRLDALQARADEAVHRIAADGATREARAQYTARREREARAQAEPAARRQAESSDGIEIEL